MRPATAAEIARWDDLVLANPDGGHILQTRAWGEFKRQHGWRPLYAVAGSPAQPLALLLLRRRYPALGEMWYAPKGPGVATAEAMGELAAELHHMRGPFLVKVEPELVDSAPARAALQRAGFAKSPHDVQMSRATIIVDIRGSEDELLARFKPKTRYNIRLAARHGVTVSAVPATAANVARMHALMQATRERAGFVLRPLEYFRGYWQLQEAAGQGQLFFAQLDGSVLAGVYVTFLGHRGWYKDGGSTKEHANVMAPHLLQWEVMRFLRARGVHTYDLVAVPPRDQLQPEHPLHGLYRFKSGFSEEITEFVGAWDLVLQRPRALLWAQLLERAEHHWARLVRHDLFY